jgi:quinol monooxygenase YgiN
MFAIPPEGDQAMSHVISWNLQLNVRDGCLDHVRALMSEMVEATREESGTLGYEWFLTEDGSACHICERYADSGAAMEHLGNFGANFAERFLGCFAPTAFFVYGDPSDEVRGVLDGFGAVYLGTLGGFTR